MSKTGWEHYHHVADIGVRGYGATVAEAFEQAALALAAVVSDPSLIVAQDAVDISCSAPDHEYLLVDWLNGIIYEMAVRNMLVSRFSVSLTEDSLTGRAWGEAVDVARHAPAVEVKGATFTTLKVEQQKSGLWIAQCVVDV